MHFNLIEIIKTVGLVGVWGIVFAESGLFFGFFLPGDSLLFTAGILASQGYLNIWALAIGCFVAAVVGDTVGFVFGRKVGPKLFSRPDSKIFKKSHLNKAHQFYEKHGAKTIVLARFMPFIRTFAPIVAGAADMHYATFFTYNLIGGAIWGLGMPILGYFLGQVVPDIEKYLLPVIAVIVLASVAPGVYHYIKSKTYKKDEEILKKTTNI